MSGIAHEGGVAAGVDRPRPLPAQTLDHGTGYLAAFGAMVCPGNSRAAVGRVSRRNAWATSPVSAAR